MSIKFTEKNTTEKYLSKELIPITKTEGIWYDESQILPISENDSENFLQFLEDIKPKPLESNSNIISLPNVINALPPLIKNQPKKIENSAPIKNFPENDKNFIKSFRSGTRSVIIKSNEFSQKDYENLPNKEKLWIIAKTTEKIYIPNENGEILLRLKGCGMWTQKNPSKFPSIYLMNRECYRKDKDNNKKYIEIRGFNSINSSARELNALKEIKFYFDKFNFLIGNFPLGFWKYENLINDPAKNIEKCVCIMKTLADKRLETHFICGSEKILLKIINQFECENLMKKIEIFYNNFNLKIPNKINSTFKRANNFDFYKISEKIKNNRFDFKCSFENFEEKFKNFGFLNSAEIIKFFINFPKLHLMSLIYAEIGFEIGKFLSIFHRSGFNWGTFYNDDIRLIDSNAHADNIIILERKKVKERFKKENFIQFFSMVDFDQIVRPEISINVWEGKIKKDPEICTEYFWVELESFCNDLGGIATEKQFFYNIPKRSHPEGNYYNLLFVLRDVIIFEFMMSYVDPNRKRTFEIEDKIDECYDFIESCLDLTQDFEA